ncbi:hypothetical protein [Cerasicoccus maritimus]|uniref:hypothetical protein n=1 Tax=Cerasicoccus maritimus TaxID=490089 RepID=UPI0028526BFE|nr:hypothetical protein [Cerasicoccus maritimus]
MNASNLTGQSILICDNSLTLRKIIAGSLEEQQPLIVEASTGSEALSILSSTAFDIIFLGTRLIDCSAEVILEKIDSASAVNLTSVVLISSNQQTISEYSNEFSTVSNGLIKPVTKEKVQRVYQDAFTKKQSVSVRSGRVEDSIQGLFSTEIQATLSNELSRVAAHIPNLEGTRPKAIDPKSFYLKYLASNRLTKRLADIVNKHSGRVSLSGDSAARSSGALNPALVYDVLTDIEQRSISGTLYLETPEETVQLCLHSGSLSGVATTNGKRLRECLADIDHPALGGYIEAIPDTLPLYTHPILADWGLADAARIFVDVYPQLTAHLLRIACYENCRFRLVEDADHWLAVFSSETCEPLVQAFVRALRANCSERQKSETSSAFLNVYRRRFYENPSWIESSLNSDELWMLELLGAEYTIPELVASGRVSPVNASQSLNLLHRLGLIERQKKPATSVKRDYPSAPFTILVLSTCPEVTRMVQYCMQSEDIVLAVCDDTEFAMNALRRGKLDLLITDGRTKGDEGFGIIKKFQSVRGSLPWVAVEPDEGVAWVDDCINMRPESFLARPFNLAHIERTLCVVIENAKRARLARLTEAPALIAQQMDDINNKYDYLCEREKDLQRRELELQRHEATFFDSCNKLEEERACLDVMREEIEFLKLTKNGQSSSN